MVDQTGKLVHELVIAVRWSDMDAFGHVNNSVYFTYFEQTRINWWNAIMPPKLSLNDTGPVIVNASCNFYKPILNPENLIVKLFAGVPGRSSYDCFYQIFSYQNPDILYADGQTKVVWVDRKLGKSIPLPDFMCQHLPEKQAEL